MFYSPHISHIYIIHDTHRGSSSRRHWSDNIKLRQIPLDLLHMPPLTMGTVPTSNSSSSSNIPQKYKGKGMSEVKSNGNIHRKLNLSQEDQDGEEEEEEEEKKGSDSLSILEEGRQSHSTEAALLSAVGMSASVNSKSSDDAVRDEDERGAYIGINGNEYIELKVFDDLDDDDEEKEEEEVNGAYDSSIYDNSNNITPKRYTTGPTSSTSSSGYSPLKTSYTTSPILRKKKASYQVS